MAKLVDCPVMDITNQSLLIICMDKILYGNQKINRTPKIDNLTDLLFD